VNVQVLPVSHNLSPSASAAATQEFIEKVAREEGIDPDQLLF
jgi:hypothetical protein